MTSTPVSFEAGQKHLALLMTAGMSVCDWLENGSYRREMKLYFELARQGLKISIMDYSSVDRLAKLPSETLEELNELGISIVPLFNQRTPKRNLAKLFKSCTVALSLSSKFTHIKSNQSKGAWIGVLLLLRNRRSKFLHRSGYSWSDFTRRIYISQTKYYATRSIEFLVNLFATRIHVAAQPDFESLSSGEQQKCVIVPNWVEFEPRENLILSDHFTFVGRLEPQKRVLDLLEHWPQNEELVLVGEGSQAEKVAQVIQRRRLDVVHKKRLPHDQLLETISASKALIMWSSYEGNPKVVIEALFAGAPVVYRPAPGVNEVMERGQLGVCVYDVENLEQCLADASNMRVSQDYAHGVLFDSKFEFTLQENINFLSK